METKYRKILISCAIAIIIILSTIGIVFAVSQEVDVPEDDSKEYYDIYSVKVSLDTKPSQDILEKTGWNRKTNFLEKLGDLFTALSSEKNVLCCEHGAPLNNAEGYTAETTINVKGSPAQSYILSHLPDESDPYYSNVQKSWWTLLDRLGVKGDFEKCIENGEFKPRFDSLKEQDELLNAGAWNQNNISQALNRNGKLFIRNNIESEGIKILQQNKSEYEYLKNTFTYEEYRNLIDAIWLSNTNSIEEVSQFFFDAEGKVTNTLGFENEATSETFVENKLKEKNKNITDSEIKKQIDILKSICKEIRFNIQNQVEYVGSDYNVNDYPNLYKEAIEYEMFYNGFSKKENRKISMDIDNMKVNFNTEYNAYLVGPITLNYYAPNFKFAGIKDFLIEVDGVKLETQYKNADGIVNRTLNYGEYALVDGQYDYKLCGSDERPYPASGNEFYIMFAAGQKERKITRLGFTYEHMEHQSEYGFYKLTYNGMDMQDLAEIYSAHLWMVPTSLEIDFGIDRNLEIKKSVPNSKKSDTFYFKVYDEKLKNREDTEKYEFNGIEYGLFTQVTVTSGSSKNVELESYKREGEWINKVPQSLVIEVDSQGHTYKDYLDGKCTEESIWDKYKPANGSGIYIQDYVESKYVSEEIINDELDKHYHLTIDKKIKENPQNEMFNIKLELKANGKTNNYILPLLPADDNAEYTVYCSNRVDNNGYYICGYENIDSYYFGKVYMYKGEDGFLHAKWSLRIDGIITNGDTYQVYSKDSRLINVQNVEKIENISYKFSEVDENYKTYSEYIQTGKEDYNSFWYKYQSPDYVNASGTLKDCYCTDRKENIKKSSEGIIVNYKSNKKHVALDLKKILENGKTSNEEFLFNVYILRNSEKDENYVPDPKEENKLVDATTLKLIANGENVHYDKEIYTQAGYKYYVVIEEQDTRLLDITRHNTNVEWHVEKNKDGKITKIWAQMLENDPELYADFTNINADYSGNFKKFHITKVVKVGENDLTEEFFKQNPDREFVFKSDLTKSKLSVYDFKDEDIQKGFVYEKDGVVYIKINKDNYKAGVTSKEIYWPDGKSAPVYGIYEIDEDGKTYTEWYDMKENKSKDSIFNSYTPKNLGYYVIDFNKKEETIEIEVENMQNGSAKLNIIKELVGENITDADKDKEFTVTLLINPIEDGKVFIGDKVYTKDSPYVNKEIKISVNSPYISEEISWSGKAPTYQVIENTETMPKGWNLYGYKVKEEKDGKAEYTVHSYSEPRTLKDNEENSLIIENEKDSDKKKIVVSKSVVDKNGNLTPTDEDVTMLFDIYVAKENGTYKDRDIVSYEKGNYSENKYVLIDTLKVFIPTGSCQGVAQSDLIFVDKNTDLEYKVVEVDEEHHKYKDENCTEDGFWKKFKPTELKDGKIVETEGIWEGILTENEPNSSVARILACNEITIVKEKKYGWLTIDKSIVGGDWQEEEKFGFEIKDSNGKNVTKKLFDEKLVENDKLYLTYENKVAISKIVVWTSEDAPTYTITEVDYDKEIYKPTEESISLKLKDVGISKIAEVTGKTIEDIEKLVTINDDNDYQILNISDKKDSEIKISGYAGFINNADTWYHARLHLVKQVDGDWEENEKYTFEIKIKEDGKPEATIKATVTEKEPQFYLGEFKWKKGQKAPQVSVKEIDMPKNATLELTVDNGVKLNPEEWYTLKDGDGFENSICEYTILATNHKEFGNFKIIKIDPTQDDTYTFGYQYSTDGGKTWDNIKEIEVIANSVGAETEKTQLGDDTKFRVWEKNGNIESISAVNAGETKEFTTKEGYKGIEGTLNSKTQVEVKVKNAETKSGKIKVIKRFYELEGKQNNMLKLLEDVAAYYGGNYEFKFNLTVYYDDNSTFKWSKDNYKEEHNKATITVTKTISDFIAEYKKSNDIKDITIIDDIEVKWSGEAPKFEVSENNSQTFFEGVVSKVSAGEGKSENYGSISNLQEGKTIKVTCKNTYDSFSRYGTKLVTSLAGDVWIDKKEDGKTVKNNNKLDSNDQMAKDVYVVPYACVVDKNNNIIEKWLNTDNRFIMDNDSFYKYIDNGHWEFSNVAVPAFNLKDEKELNWYNKGYRMKYYIDFYYNGMKYEAVKPLVDAEAKEILDKANEYMKLSSDYKKFFVDSCAMENEKVRVNYNSKYAILEGNTVMGSDGKSQGNILDSKGNLTTTVDYQTQNIGGLEGSKIQRAITTGTVNMPSGQINSIDDLNKNYMLASTAEVGLKYFFANDWIGKDGTVYMIDQITLNDISGYGSSKSAKRYIDKDPYDGRDKVVFDYGVSTRYKSIDYAQHINLGLVERDLADVSLEKQIESATLIINDKVFTYTFDNTNAEEILKNENFDKSLDQFVRTIDNELKEMLIKDKNDDNKELNVYTSDYYYRTSMYEGTDVEGALNKFYDAIYGVNKPDAESNSIKTKELQIYLTYSITVSNYSGQYGIRIYEIDDYYDSSLEYIDVANGYQVYNNANTNNGPGLWAYIEDKQKEETELTNVFANNKHDDYYKNSFKTIKNQVPNVANGYNKMTFEEEIDLNSQKGNSKTYYLTYKVKNYSDIDGIILGVKNNVAEISKFAPYEKFDENNNNITKYAAVIDKDSAPGNYNIADAKNVMEDDTDLANCTIKTTETTDQKRSISGTAWLDKEEASNEKDGQKLGNSLLKDGYKIEGLNVELVEVIDLPTVDDSGNITDTYNEYEFYWNVANSKETGVEGKYTFDSYIDEKNRTIDGLVSGNYIVRFFYGNKDTKMHDSVGNIVEDKPQINGEDYKTTAYRIGNKDATERDENGYINNEWKDIINPDDPKDNEARDNEARRLKVIQNTQVLDNEKTEMFNVLDQNENTYISNKNAKKYDTATYKKIKEDYNVYKQEIFGGNLNIKNGTYAYNGIIDDAYFMFADTAKMNMKVENLEANEMKATDKKDFKVENINLGLEERSETRMYLDKQIKEITLTLSSGKELLYVLYDIDYAKTIKELQEKYNDDQITATIDGKFYVGVKENKEKSITGDNLQAVNTQVKNGHITQGFRYINIDPTQGLNVDIKYQFTALNLSETDKYGEGLRGIIYKDGVEVKEDERETKFNDAIEKLISHEYKLDGNKLKLSSTGEYKTYGEYLGHTYYQGFKDGDEVWENEYPVSTTVRQIVDYVDNNIAFDETYKGKIDDDSEKGIEVDNTLWSDKEIVKNDKGEYTTKKVNKYIVDSGFKNDHDSTYSTILTSMDSKIENDFVTELTPMDYKNNKKYSATMYLDLSRIVTSTDKGDTGVDNFAEILVIENTVGRRDMRVIHGNWNPKGGATLTTERDETGTEIVTLSPPTGNYENDRNNLIAVSVICVVAILSGVTIGFKKKFSNKNKKS